MARRLNLAVSVERAPQLRLVRSREVALEPIAGTRKDNFPRLLEKLDEVVRSKPGEYSEDTIGRVRGLVDYKIKNPKFRVPLRRFLTDIKDWKLYFSLHDEWQGMSTSTKGMSHNKELEAGSFYVAFTNWTHWAADAEAGRRAAESGLDEKQRVELQKRIRKAFVETLFPPRHNDRSGLVTIEDWKREFAKHPEWQGFSTDDMTADKEPGAFYAAFRIWTHKSAKAEADRIAAEKGLSGKQRTELQKRIRKLLVRELFPPRQNDWSFLVSMEDWKQEFAKHPEWQGLSIEEMKECKTSGGNAFCQAFRSWTHKSAKAEADRIAAEKGLSGKQRTELQKRIQKSLVRELLPRARKDWSFLVSIGDWKEEFGKHPEWQGLSTVDMFSNKEPGARSFYMAFTGWAKRQAKAEADRIAAEKSLDVKQRAKLQKIIRRSLVETVLPLKNNDRSDLVTIEDWKREFAKHPEWQGFSTADMAGDKRPGAYAFYGAFSKWTRVSAKAEADRVAAENGLDEKQRAQLQKRIRKSLVETLFPARYTDWSALATIEAWKQEFAKHPEWQGFSTADMLGDRASGAAAFYEAFASWTHRSARAEADRATAENGLDNNEKSVLKNKIRKALVRSIFPERQAPFKYEFEQGKVIRFGSYPERLVGLLLHKYGLVSSFEDERNVHVRTNGRKRHNLDFLVGRRFIEFHPLSIGEIKAGRTIEDVRARREQNITNPEFSRENGFSMLFIWELNQFHSVVLQDPEIRGILPEQYRDRTYEQFRADLREAYQKSIGYDIVNPPEKRKRRKKA